MLPIVSPSALQFVLSKANITSPPPPPAVPVEPVIVIVVSAVNVGVSATTVLKGKVVPEEPPEATPDPVMVALPVEPPLP